MSLREIGHDEDQTRAPVRVHAGLAARERPRCRGVEDHLALLALAVELARDGDRVPGAPFRIGRALHDPIRQLVGDAVERGPDRRGREGVREDLLDHVQHAVAAARGVGQELGGDVGEAAQRRVQHALQPPGVGRQRGRVVAEGAAVQADVGAQRVAGPEPPIAAGTEQFAPSCRSRPDPSGASHHSSVQSGRAPCTP